MKSTGGAAPDVVSGADPSAPHGLRERGVGHASSSLPIGPRILELRSLGMTNFVVSVFSRTAALEG